MGDRVHLQKERKKERYVNKYNGRVYIGLTNNLGRRVYEHRQKGTGDLCGQRYLYHALIHPKSGWNDDNWQVEILHQWDEYDGAALAATEIRIIHAHYKNTMLYKGNMSISTIGYNLTIGGEGIGTGTNVWSEWHVLDKISNEKISTSVAGKYLTTPHHYTYDYGKQGASWKTSIISHPIQGYDELQSLREMLIASNVCEGKFQLRCISITENDINVAVAKGRQRVEWLNQIVEDWCAATNYNDNKKRRDTLEQEFNALLKDKRVAQESNVD
jgi:hypothetical protein